MTFRIDMMRVLRLGSMGCKTGMPIPKDDMEYIDWEEKEPVSKPLR